MGRAATRALLQATPGARLHPRTRAKPAVAGATSGAVAKRMGRATNSNLIHQMKFTNRTIDGMITTVRLYCLLASCRSAPYQCCEQ